MTGHHVLLTVVFSGVVISSLGTVRIFPAFADPAEHPLASLRWVKPPGEDVLPRTSMRFAGYRGGCSAAAFKEYAKQGLGDVWWPQYPVLNGNKSQLKECFDAVLDANLTVMDISNYVPGDTDVCDGSPPASGGVCEYHLPRTTQDLLEQTLGDNFLGMDNGEQDGRYISYAGQMFGMSAASRQEQYLNFARHFQRMTDDLGSHMMSLNSLYYTHYFAQTGLYTLLGSESAQGLPNDQLYYSFLRGAAKTHGNLLWATPSIFNHWGYKTCNSTGCSASGTSLNLLKRLLYAEMAYQCNIFGFEGATVDGEYLTPIGRMQHAGVKFVSERKTEKGAAVGNMLATIGVMLDFYAGFTPPRHLYSGDVYRVWGNVPYSTSDHFTHAVLNVLYPDYERAAFYHNEDGFLSSTPYGDVVDVLLNDAPSWLLKRYAVLVVGGAITSLPRETKRKIKAYVSVGGVVIVSAETMKSFGELFGVTVGEEAMKAAEGSVFEVNCAAVGAGTTSNVKEQYESLIFDLGPLPSNATVVARLGEKPAAIKVSAGKGFALVLATSGITSKLQSGLPFTSKVDTPLPVPFPMLTHVQVLLHSAFSAHAVVFQVPGSDGVSLITGRRQPGEYSVVITNNVLHERPLSISSNIGQITEIVEVQLDASEKNASGFLPSGFERTDIGRSTNSTIAGGDTRFFEIKVQESVSTIHSEPTAIPSRRALRVYGSLQEAVWTRPTFLQHFDTVIVDWRYIENQAIQTLAREGSWAMKKGIRIVVDFTSGLNLYPDLRLCKNSVQEYTASVERIKSILMKMSVKVNASTATMASAAFSSDAILTGHRSPENYYSASQCLTDFIDTFQDLVEFSAPLKLRLHLRTEQNKLDLPTAVHIVSSVSADNFKLAPSTALLERDGITSAADLKSKFPGLKESQVSLWFVASSSADPLNAQNVISVHAPLTEEGARVAAQISAFAPHALVAFDAVLPGSDAEVEEAESFEQANSSSSKLVII